MKTDKKYVSNLSEKLAGQINDLFGSLMLLGLSVKEDGDNVKVIAQSFNAEDEILFDQDRQNFGSHTLADLVNIRESVIFLRGVGELKERIAALGWNVYDDASSYGRRTTLQMNDGWSAIYERTQKNLIEIQERVERAELTKRLYEYHEMASRAGICLKISDESFEFTLQENDPALKRRLTQDNVDKFTALVRAWTPIEERK